MHQPRRRANRNEDRRKSVKVAVKMAKTENRHLGEFLELQSFFFPYESNP
jgi:hypothetical protein